jgi:hypothetical protein
MAFMPSMVRRTASPPLWATSTEWRATSEARSELPEIASVDAAMLPADSVAPEICLVCALEALARCADSACVCRVAPSSWMADWLIVATRSRNTPMA